VFIMAMMGKPLAFFRALNLEKGSTTRNPA